MGRYQRDFKPLNTSQVNNAMKKIHKQLLPIFKDLCKKLGILHYWHSTKKVTGELPFKYKTKHYDDRVHFSVGLTEEILEKDLDALYDLWSLTHNPYNPKDYSCRLRDAIEKLDPELISKGLIQAPDLDLSVKEVEDRQVQYWIDDLTIDSYVFPERVWKEHSQYLSPKQIEAVKKGFIIRRRVQLKEETKRIFG